MENNTQSLSGALNNLIKAYEDLQKENIDLKVEIKGLKNENAKLNDELEKANSTNNKQSQDINSMVGKINSLLKSDSPSISNSSITSEPEKSEPTPAPKTEIRIETNSDDESLVQRVETPVNDTKSKIDLNKMESLLNGFGGNS